MPHTTRNDFHQMLLYSVGLHLLLLIAFFAAPSLFYKPMVETSSTTTMDVMWAEMVTSPPKTSDSKLPGPAIPQEESQPEPSQEPKYTLNEKPKQLTKAEILKQEELDRKKKMKEALAGLPTTKDDRPAPDLNNFQSVEGAEKKGMPASPFGGGNGKLTGDPEFAKYQNIIRKTILNNRVWIGSETNLHAEVSFKLAADGTVLNPVIFKSSGNNAYDSASLRAVLKSSPLPTPPEKLTNQIVKEYFIIIFDPRMK